MLVISIAKWLIWLVCVVKANDVYVNVNGTLQLLTPELKKMLREERKQAALAADKEIRFLDPKKYNESLSNDAWLVFFGEDTCSHCQRFTPKWLTVQQKLMASLDGYGLHMVKLECTQPVAREICDSFNFDGYPNILFFKNGKRVEEYLGDTEVNELAAFAEVKKWQLVAENATAGGVFAQAPEMNGSSITLNALSFGKVKGAVPWIVKFFAPWCHHCQALAPIWDEMAARLKGKVAVGAVDCTVYGSLCLENKIKGYPTVLFFAGSEPETYSGSRTVDSLLGFALSKYYFSINSVMPHQLRAEIGGKVASVVLVYQPMMAHSANVEFLIKAIVPFAKPLELLVLPDTDFQHSKQTFNLVNMSNVSSETEAVLVITRQKMAEQIMFPPEKLRVVLEQHFGNVKAVNELQDWTSAEKRPPVEELSSENAPLLLSSEAYLFLAVVKDRAVVANVEQSLRAAAMNLSQQSNSDVYVQPLMRGIGKNQVVFAWIDSTQWDGYLKRVFGYDYQTASAATAYVFEPSKERYWDAFSDGRQFTHDEALASLQSVRLNSAAPPKSTETGVRRFGTMLVNGVDAAVSTVYDNYIALLFIFCVLFIFLCIKFKRHSISSSLPQHSRLMNHWTRRPPKTSSIVKLK